MGFLRNILGYDDERSSTVYMPSSYTTSVGSPNVTTNTTINAAERAKEAENPDTAEYEESVKKRRKKNGVRGTFTSGMDTSGVAAESDAIGK